MKFQGQEITIPETMPKFGFSYPFNDLNTQRQIDKMRFFEYDLESARDYVGDYIVTKGIFTLQYPFSREDNILSVGVYKEEVVSFCHVGMAFTLEKHRNKGLGSAVFAYWMQEYGVENYSKRVGAKYTEAGLRMVLSAHRKMVSYEKK